MRAKLSVGIDFVVHPFAGTVRQRSRSTEPADVAAIGGI
jgi:hypothetical protein